MLKLEMIESSDRIVISEVDDYLPDVLCRALDEACQSRFDKDNSIGEYNSHTDAHTDYSAWTNSV